MSLIAGSTFYIVSRIKFVHLKWELYLWPVTSGAICASSVLSTYKGTSKLALPSCWALHCGCGVSMPPSRKCHVCTGVWSGWVSCWDWGYQLWGLARGEEADVRTATLGWGNIPDEQKYGSFRGLNHFRNQCRDSCLLHWFSGSVAPSSHWAPWMGCVIFSLVVVAVWSLSCVTLWWPHGR